MSFVISTKLKKNNNQFRADSEQFLNIDNACYFLSFLHLHAFRCVVYAAQIPLCAHSAHTHTYTNLTTEIKAKQNETKLTSSDAAAFRSNDRHSYELLITLRYMCAHNFCQLFLTAPIVIAHFDRLSVYLNIYFSHIHWLDSIDHKCK